MPNKREIYETVSTLIQHEPFVSAEYVLLESRLVEDLGLADTLDLISLRWGLEDEFDIDIPDEDAERFVTVQDVVDYVAAALEEE